MLCAAVGVIALAAFASHNPSHMHTHDLTAARWSVRPVGETDHVPEAVRGRAVEARVPGCVHTDLMRAGAIADPYVGLNEREQFWVGETDWEYRCTFDLAAGVLGHERVELVCDGLDTVAVVALNGEVVGESQDMHVPHRFDVKRVARERANELVVTFRSPNAYARQWESRLGTLPYLNCPVPFNFIRKMACGFGWDWGPVTATSGIWRGVRVEGWSGVRIVSVVPTVDLSEPGRARVRVRARVEGAAAVAEYTLTGPDGAVHRGAGANEVVIDVADPKLWWPRGHGEQPLYTLEVNVGGATWSGRMGLRTVELDTAPDAVGSAFVLKVNGKPIFCKGFNWVPDDCFLDRACTRERYAARIGQAVEANANMLRVWGGGIFETDDFYDVCDELGVLVWQDFLFACAAYPEEEPFRSLVEQEVRHNVARLARHPSLAIWNGCNENLWGYHDWGWKSGGLVKGRTWGPGYYLELIPRLMKEIDPSRPYWAASPWSGDADVEGGLHPNLAGHGNKHVWEAWFGADAYDVYRRFTPRFCSEFGFQGPATFAGIARTVPGGAPLDFAHPQVRQRQKSTGIADDGDRRNLRHLARVFDVPGLHGLRAALQHPLESKPADQWPRRPGPVELATSAASSGTNFDDLHYLLQVNQARALTLGVEWFRSRAPVCMGTLYWQLNDAWPGGTTWSAIDGDGRPKPLWFATRRFYAPRLLTIQPMQDQLELCAVNDADEPWQGGCELYLLDMPTGRREDVRELRLDVPARGVQRLAIPWAPAVRPRDPRAQVLVAQSPAGRAVWFYAPDKELAYPRAELNADLSRDGDTYRLTLRARSLVRDLCVFADRLDPAATVSDQLLTLLPGEEAVLEIRSRCDLSLAALTGRPVMRCVNEFGAA